MFRTTIIRKVPLLYGLLLTLLLSMAACQPIQPVSAMKVETADTTSQENKAVVERFYEEVINQNHIEVFEEIFDPNVIDHQLGLGPDVGDPAREGFLPDLHVNVDLWVIEGDLLTAVVTLSGTHQAEWMGVPATGNTVTWSHIDIWRVKDGKIVEVWHNFPSTDMLQQIGYTLVPPAQ